MSHIRPGKSLETPRPLKSTSRQTHSHTPLYEIQSTEELISLLENVASKQQLECNDQESMSILISNLRILGPQLELISKYTLDRAFVTFRNSSLNPELNIMTRLNLLEIIELRAKLWKVTDGSDSYYKHKVTNVEPDTTSVSTLNDNMTLLSTSPPSLSLIGQSTGPILGLGEILKPSGKFPRPTKIPGKNYSKDEVVIRNADSGKVMGIKGRRVHMIEELSETIISFQRVNPGAKERLVQITGPNEEKIVHAKQLIEDTIRRNASPVRLEQTQGGSCSSLASSASDETQPRNTNNNRNSTGGSVSGMLSTSTSSSTVGNLLNNYVPNITTTNIGGGGNIKLSRNGLTGGQNMLLHSFSTNDASLGEYKYTVNVGQHNIKITGESCELVRVAKLVLDDYFSSNEFAAALEAGAGFDTSTSSTSSSQQYIPSMIPQSHQLISSSPFVDSGISLDLLSKNSQIGLSNTSNNNSYDNDDDVFIVENPHKSIDESSINLSLSNAASSTPLNGLTRSRRSHFLRKDSTPEATIKDTNKEQSTVRIVHEYERLLYYSKSPHSTALPLDNEKISKLHPSIVKNKVIDEKTRFDPDKHLNSLKSVELANITNTSESNNNSSESPDPE